MNTHYPENLLRDYEILLKYFPSHTVCRPKLVEVIQHWQETQKKESFSMLEVGSGFGESTGLILDAIQGVNMTLVELDGPTAEELRKNLSTHTEKFKIVQENAISWINTQNGESYDAFTASWTVHNFPEGEREDFLKEVYRVLKPGGLFVLFDKILPDNQDVVNDMWEVHLNRMQRLDDIGRSDLKISMLTHEERDAKKPYVWYESEFFATLHSIGFTEVTIHMRNERDVVVSAIR